MSAPHIIRTPDQRLRVFVSSTLQELAEERAAAKEAILKLRLSPVLFELGARPHPAQALYRAYLEQSHIFVGIYWQRYGWVAPEMTISGLEDEYRLCGDRPKLIYVKTPAADREPRLKQLLDAIKNDSVSYKPFSSALELQQLIEDDLSLLLTEQFEAAQERLFVTETAPTELRLRALPASTNALIGREREISAIKDLLLRHDVRLVTLVGPGGVGKTRLSLEVARLTHDHFADGVCFVSLASVRDGNGMLAALAQAIGLRETGEAANPRPLLDRVIELLHDKQMLLVLDNFEQTVSAAPLIAELLSTSPRLEIIVSSREVLRITGEYEFEVAPLPLPELNNETVQSLSGNEAVQLFVERAQAARAGFALTVANAHTLAEICRRLDGLPLALELAAARLRLLTPQALLAHLNQSLSVLNSGSRDAPERQRTLRQAIDWSYGLLNPEEQRTFARFAVFVGGGSLDAAEQMLSLSPVENVLEQLSSLVDKSLIQHVQSDINGAPRLSMLQTIREYAIEKLRDYGEIEAMRKQHTQYFNQLIQQAQAQMNSAQEGDWLDQLEQERDNLSAALEWLLNNGQAEAAAHMAWTLWQFWVAHTNLREWQQWTDIMLTQLPEETSARGKALALSGAIASWQADYARGIPLLEQSVTLFERQGENTHAANALMMLGLALMNQGDIEQASRVLSKGLALD